MDDEKKGQLKLPETTSHVVRTLFNSFLRSSRTKVCGLVAHPSRQTIDGAEVRFGKDMSGVMR